MRVFLCGGQTKVLWRVEYVPENQSHGRNLGVPDYTRELMDRIRVLNQLIVGCGINR